MKTDKLAEEVAYKFISPSPRLKQLRSADAGAGRFIVPLPNKQ